MKKVVGLWLVAILGFAFFLYLYITNLVKNYDKYFNISMGGFNIDSDTISNIADLIIGKSLLESFQCTVTMKNSSIFLYRISNTNVKIFYNGTLVANVSSANEDAPIILTPYRVVNVDLILDAYNSSALSSMVTNALAMKDTKISYEITCNIFGFPIDYKDVYTVKL